MKINEIVNARMAVNLVEGLVKLADVGAILTIKIPGIWDALRAGWLGHRAACFRRLAIGRCKKGSKIPSLKQILTLS